MISHELSDIVNDTKVITTYQDVGLIANIIKKIVNTGNLSTIENATVEETKNVIL